MAARGIIELLGFLIIYSHYSFIFKLINPIQIVNQLMQDIGGKYPEWLDSHRESLDPGQLKLYEEQYGYIQQICAVYETDPNNYMKIMELLQEVRRFF